MDDIVAPDLSHEQRLDRLAEIAVRIGVRLAAGQELVIGAPIEGVPLARRITEYAYKASASLVTTIFGDDASTLLRFKHAPDESFDKATGWLYDAMATALGNGAAWLMIAGDDPTLLAGQDPEKVARADRARWQAYLPALQHIFNFDINWAIVSYATPAWAKAIFPNDAEEVAVDKLWDAIFAASRVDTPDPIAAWQTHNDALAARSKQTLCRVAFPRSGHRSPRRPSGRSRMGRRRVEGEERHRVQSEHPLGGGVYRAAQGSR